MPRECACARSSSRVWGDSLRKSTMVTMPSFFSSTRLERCGCAPRKRESETFPALRMPGRVIFVAKEGEGEEEGEAREGDCRNGTEDERRGTKKTRKRERKRIENWQERV